MPLLTLPAKRYQVPLGAFGVFLLSITAAHATSFIQRPFPDTVRDAPTIVHGKVGMSYADWGKSEEGSKRLYTFYELQISEVIKGTANGNSANTLIMREIGGEKDGVGLQVPGSAQFTRGEDVVVLLSNKNTDGSFDVWGLTMGKYDLQRDENGQDVLSGAGISAQADSDGMIHPDDLGQNDTRTASKWTLDRLRQLVQSQNGAAHDAKMAKTPMISPVQVSPKPEVKPLTSASPEAPALQPDPPKGNGSLSLGITAKAALALMLAGAVFWIRRTRR